MTTTLLRRFNPLPWLALLVVLLAGARPALATHLLGGEMTYKYLGTTNPPAALLYRYEITTSVYVACNNSNTSSSLSISFFQKATGAVISLGTANVGSANGSANGTTLVLSQSSISSCTSISVPPGCAITGASQPYQLQKFVGIICLPASSSGAGYYATTVPSGGRNTGITNLGGTSSSNYTLGLYSTLAPPTIANSSPVFTGNAVGLICAGDTTVVLNNAVDADGDRLEYTFGQPYTGLGSAGTFTLMPLVPYTTPGGYAAATPLGTGVGYYAKINASTGVTKYVGGPTVGNRYGIAVDVTEYRTINGVEVALGTTRRDIQLLVGLCPAVAPPVLPTVAALPRSYTIEAGSTLSIPVTGTQAAAHPLTLTATSALLDGSSGYVATFGGNPGTLTYAGSPVGAYTVTGTTGGTVAGTFVFTPTCAQARATPYDVTLVLQDIGCAGKLASDVLRITVVKPTGPTTITGSLTVCGLNTTQTYTASGGTAPGVQWAVTGGTIVGSATANPVTVRWPTAGAGTITTQGVSQYGCLTDLVTRNVTVSPIPVLTATGNLTICQGGSTTLTVTGTTGPYLLTGGAAPVSGAGPFVLSPTQTTTYTLAAVVLPASGCPPAGQVTITVNPLPVANAGAATTICSGSSAQLGAAALAGTTYSWSPATGLSSSTVANPTVTLTNTTGAPITQTYTLTATTTASGCQASSPVVVTVAPPPVAVPGAAVAFCTGGSGQLGASPVAGLSYNWSPATGLSSSTVANPTVTLTNTTSAPITQTYTLTVTSATGCSATGTVAATVHPAPTANAGAAVAFCAGGSGQLGASPVAGLSYSWSPATGLSSSSAANPTVTLTNTTGAPITQTYTLTVTNAAGCVGTASVAVTVSPLPAASTGAAAAFCAGGNAQLGAPAVAGLSYSWSPATGLSSSSVANPTVTLANATSAAITQTYTLTVTNANGCVGTGTVGVTVNPLPVVVPGSAIAFCAGSSGQLGASPVAGLSYSWSPATGLSSATVANPTVTLTNTTGVSITQTYTLTVTSATGCSATGTVAATVNPAPTANAGAAVAFCAGGSGQLGASPVAGLSYSWSPATGLSSSTIANPTVTLSNATGAASTQTYTLTVTSATGCSATGTVAVTVNPAPTANAGAAVAFCAGSSGQLGASPVAGYTYSWSPATGLSSATVANPTVTLPNATSVPITQTYTLTVTSATGCLGTGTVAVAVLPATLPGTIGTSQTVCAGSTPAPLTSTAAASGGAGTYAYQWESSPDNITWATLANATGLTCAPGPVAATTYFRRRVTAGTCGSVYSNVVTVTTQPLLVPAVALPVLPAQCAGLPFTFIPAPTNAGSAPTYQWFVNGVGVASGPTYSSTTLADGDLVRVELTPTAGFCASGIAAATARVSLTPVAAPTATVLLQTALPACVGVPLTFGLGQATNAGASPQYQWQVDGVSVAGATSTVFTSSTLRNGQAVTLVLRTTNACGQPATATSAAVRVAITQPAQLSAGPNKTIMEGETVVLEGTADGSYPVTWSPAQTLTFVAGNQLRPVAAPLVTTTYALSAGAGSCGGSSLVTVTVLPRVRIPNAFSPNGDNNDDTWQIDNIGQYANNRVIVFNRWGNKIFESANYSRGSEWNGTINGQPAPFGTYYYLITLGNGKSYTGPITVIN